MQAGEVASRDLTAAYLQRIAEIDRAGPTLQAVLELIPDALALAERLDAERAAGHVRGPLHGIPVLNLTENRLDAIVAVTGGPAWLIDPVNGDAFTGGSSTLGAVAGYPSVTVPAGFDLGLPIGMSVFGRAWSEARLLSLASDFEAKTQARQQPRFLPTVELR